MAEKEIQIKVNFSSSMCSSVTTHDDLPVLERNIDRFYSKIGLKNRSINYSIKEINVDHIDYIWMTADYIARIIWAFWKQGKLSYLDSFYQAFILYKIGKISTEQAMEAIFLFQQSNPSAAHGLVEFFGFRSASVERNSFKGPTGRVVDLRSINILEWWCDGLQVCRTDKLNEKVGILFESDDIHNRRWLKNPLKSSFFNPLTTIHHLESLNLLIGLTLEKIMNNDKSLVQKFYEIISGIYRVLRLNPSVLDDTVWTNECVHHLMKDYARTG